MDKPLEIYNVNRCPSKYMKRSFFMQNCEYYHDTRVPQKTHLIFTTHPYLIQVHTHIDICYINMLYSDSVI